MRNWLTALMGVVVMMGGMSVYAKSGTAAGALSDRVIKQLKAQKKENTKIQATEASSYK